MIQDIFDNHSCFAVQPFRLRDRQGADVLVVVAKMSWEAVDTGRVHALVPQRPVRDRDEHNGSDPNSSMHR